MMTEEAGQNLDSGGATDEEEDEPMGMADALFLHGDVLRKLRLMEQADLEEREQHEANQGETLGPNQIDDLPNGKSVLRYSSYLEHQRYYDDLKHVDCTYIDYGIIEGGGRLIIEQDKTLGKGGLCWDAASILAEHLIANEDEWKQTREKTTKVVEVGSGTGLCGLMVAKAIPHCHVHITDLPELLYLMERNAKLNFDSKAIVRLSRSSVINTASESTITNTDISLSDADKQALYGSDGVQDAKKAAGLVSPYVLRWGEVEDYHHGPFDVVMGADVVASLYDPIALARTIHSLCHETSLVYISYKGRLTGPHQQFEDELRISFENVVQLKPSSRNKNPDVWILKASAKRRVIQHE